MDESNKTPEHADQIGETGQGPAASSRSSGHEMPPADREVGTDFPSTPADPMLGRTIHQRYRLFQLIGRGAMGRVYAAKHVTTDQRFAVKLLSPAFAADPIIVERFRREAMAAARLRHEGCVEVFDYGQEHDGTFFIVMEFIEGIGLGEELAQRGVMTVERVAHIGVQLLHALGAAHASGILHRDLKPQNIMLTQRFTRPDFVKVVDFGIAKMIHPGQDAQTALTIPGTVFGTPEYMSPEQARGLELDPRSDMFSAAVVLWQLLLGESPFRGASATETLQRVIFGEPRRPSESRSEIPRAFEALLLRAMRKDPRQRFADVDAFRDAIEPYTDGAYIQHIRHLETEHATTGPRRTAPHAPEALLVDGNHMPGTEDSVVPISTGAKTEDSLVAIREVNVDAHDEFSVRTPKFAPRGWIAAVAVLVVGIGGALWGTASPSDEAPKAPAVDISAEASPAALASAWRFEVERAQKAQEAADWSQAQEALRRAIDLRPDDARSHANLATLLWRQGNGPAALPYIRRAMELDERYQAQFAPLYRTLSALPQNAVAPGPAEED